MMYAIGKNDLEGVKYLHSKGLRINQQSLDWAIKSSSSFRLIEHLCMHGATVRFSLSKVVEQFDLLKLIKKYKEGDWGYSEHSIPAFYASQGDLDKLKWVLDQGCPCSESTMRMAVCAGHLHVVKYCHERKCPHNSDLKFYAAFRGQLRVLEFLHEQGYPWGETLSGAVENDRVDIMKWAIDHGCPTADRMVCWNAAAHGAIKCLKFAHESGCKKLEQDLRKKSDLLNTGPWNSSVLSIAVLKKHGECAAYARANGLIEEKSATEEVVK